MRPRSPPGVRAGDGAQVFVKDVPDPENFGVVVYDDAGDVVDLAEKAGIVDLRYPAPPTNDAVVGLYCYPPDVFSVIASLERSSRGELEITDVNRAYAQRGALSVVPVRGWWEDAGKHWQHLAEIGRTIDETGVEQVSVEGHRRGSRCAGSRTSAAGSASCAARACCRSHRADERLVLAPRRDPRPPLPRARPGRPLRLPPGHGPRRRPRPAAPARRSPRTSATRTRSRSTSPAATRTASRRSPTCCSSTT